MAESLKLDLTPDPKVLIALTRTRLRPIDALCELIDNAIDSFSIARLKGSAVEYPTINVVLPGAADVRDGQGAVIVRDNGPGMLPETAEKALRAGYSGSQNPYDSLGLFGMGFNISTGKIGYRTRFVTAVAKATTALEAVVDLNDLKSRRSFTIDGTQIPKPENLEHGTLIEVSGWWPEGDPNVGFIKSLAGYSKPKVRDEIGRIYATLLREQNLRIFINGEPVQPFEHCVWDDKRFVERRGHGKIYARESFDEVVGQQLRCTECNSLIDESDKPCPACSSSSTRTIHERIRGWVGIQRFDDQTHFGIDLIRNGRAIRVFEQAAFFEFVDELRNRVKDYPIDSPYGRIVGEVHLDHVPVDFLKQDFQRSSPEWQNAISFLRGESSLQPTQPGADENNSPLFWLYQGYRRVRNVGTRDLYMGVNVDGKAKRIDREVEAEYWDRFKRKEPGYHDDGEWWVKVLEADMPPTPEVTECPDCGAQNLAENETCMACGFVLLGKPCANQDCGETIPKSAASCPICGTSQIPEVSSPWRCEVCGTANDVELETCGECTKARGTPNPASPDWLRQNSEPDQELSIKGMTIDLGDGTFSQPLRVEVHLSQIPLQPIYGQDRIPVIALKSVERIEIFLDPKHVAFSRLGIRKEDVVSTEIAQYLIDTYGSRVGGPKALGNSLSTMAWRVESSHYGDRLEEDPDDLGEEIATFLADIRETLPDVVGDRAESILREMNESEQRGLFDRLMEAGHDLADIDLKESNSWLPFVDNRTLVRIVREYPEPLFDGGVWGETYSSLDALEGVKQSAIDGLRADIRARYANCIEDIASFGHSGGLNAILARRARASLDFLQSKAVL